MVLSILLYPLYISCYIMHVNLFTLAVLHTYYNTHTQDGSEATRETENSAVIVHLCCWLVIYAKHIEFAILSESVLICKVSILACVNFSVSIRLQHKLKLCICWMIPAHNNCDL